MLTSWDLLLVILTRKQRHGKGWVWLVANPHTSRTNPHAAVREGETALLVEWLRPDFSLQS